MYRFKLYHPSFKRAVTLQTDPMGWDAERKTIERDPTLHGVFVKYTPELKFVKEGRALITELFNAYGIEAEITLTIERKNVLTRAWDLQFEGILELVTLKIDRNFATCKIMDVGFYQKFKNRQDVKVNLQATADQDGNAMPGFTDITVPMHSKTIRYESLLQADSAQVFSGVTAGTWYLINDYPVEVSDDLKERQSYPTQLSSLQPESVSKYMYLISEGGTYTFDITVAYTWGAGGTYNYQADWKLVTGTPGNYTTTNIGSTYSLSLGGLITFATQSFSQNVVLNLNKNDEVYFYGVIVLSALPGSNTFTYTPSGSEFKLVGLTVSASTNATATLIHDVWKRVVRSCTGRASSFKSDYYGRTEDGYAADGAGSLRAITSGEQLRGFSIVTHPIYASAKDLFESCAAIDGVGMGLEKVNGFNRIAVEPLSYFYRNVKAMRLSFVHDIQRSVAQEYLYNEVEAGYNVWNNRGLQINNLDEVNSKRTYSLPIARVKKKLTLISPYITSGYCIEFARRSAIAKTTDTEKDKENFVIQLRRSPSLVPEKNELATQTNVIDSATSYNARLSPIQNIVRNGVRLRGGLANQEDLSIAMSIGEGNNQSVTSVGGISYNEKAIAVASLPKPLWKPEYYEFMAAPGSIDWAAFEAQPYGFVEFSASNREYVKGWLISAKPDAESNRVQFKLLAAAL